jgi:hypothetical protein
MGSMADTPLSQPGYLDYLDFEKSVEADQACHHVNDPQGFADILADSNRGGCTKTLVFCGHRAMIAYFEEALL